MSSWLSAEVSEQEDKQSWESGEEGRQPSCSSQGFFIILAFVIVIASVIVIVYLTLMTKLLKQRFLQ